jgi:hypothetical protein
MSFRKGQTAWNKGLKGWKKKTNRKRIITCEFCGVEVKKYPSWIGKHNFCCRNHFDKWKNKVKTKIVKCIFCGIEVRKYLRSKGRDFCSIECLVKKRQSEGFYKEIRKNSKGFKGKHHTEESKQKSREKHLNKKHKPETIKLLSEISSNYWKKPGTREKQSRKLTGWWKDPINKSEVLGRRKVSEESKEKNRIKSLEMWAIPGFKELQIEKLIKRWADYSIDRKNEIISKIFSSAGKHPNKKETFLFNFTDSLFPSDYKLNTRAEVLVLGGKVPDIVNVNGQKKLIEHFGTFHHGEEKTGNTKEQEEKQRVDYFKQLGWDTLIVWENELKDLEKLKTKLIEFHNR